MKAIRLVSLAAATLTLSTWSLPAVAQNRLVSASFYDPLDLDSGLMLDVSSGRNLTAGVPFMSPILRAEYWNDLAGPTGGKLDLLDASGAPSSVDIIWSALDKLSNQYVAGPTNGDSMMMNGHLFSSVIGGPGLIDVQVHQIGGSFDLAAGYDVVVYFDTEFVGRLQTLTIDDAISPVATFGVEDNSNDIVGGTPVPFDFLNDYDDAVPDGRGTYVIFKDLHGDSFSLTAVGQGFDPAYINGIQIVAPVPEPSTIAMAAIGLACFVGRTFRRRRAALLRSRPPS